MSKGRQSGLSERDWVVMMREYEANGVSRREYCRSKGAPVSTFSYQRQRYLNGWEFDRLYRYTAEVIEALG